MVAEQRQKVQERQARFKTSVANLWGKSASGISHCTVTMPSTLDARELIANLFRKALIADVHEFRNVTRWEKSHHMGVRGKDYVGLGNDYRTMRKQSRLVFYTSDERIAECLEETVRFSRNERINFLVTPIVAASAEYIEWVGTQVLPVDDF